jgi:hypothetical protein
MAIHRGPIYNNVSEVQGGTGFYRIKTSLGTIPVFIDQDYDGGGWVMVLANRGLTAGMNNLTYNNAINTANYRKNGTNNATNDIADTSGRELIRLGYNNVNAWIGLKYWSELAGRVTANSIKVVQYVHTSTVPLSGTHTFRSSWTTSGFSSTYGFQSVSNVTNIVGGVTPGFYSHASSGNYLTTFDNDQDANGGNCSTYYNNNPWWYSSCWTGNYFAGGGSHNDKPYWTGSSSGNAYNYGAVYIK